MSLTDEFDDLAAGDGGATATKQAVLSPGIYVGTVTDAVRRMDKYKAGKWPENPNGWVLTVHVRISFRDDDYAIKANVPAHKSWVVAKVFESAGLPVPVKGKPVSEGDLIGCSVTLETDVFTTPEGAEHPVVKLWLPADKAPEQDPPDLPPAAELEAAAKPARKKKADAAASESAPDDIPF